MITRHTSGVNEAQAAVTIVANSRLCRGTAKLPAGAGSRQVSSKSVEVNVDELGLITFVSAPTTNEACASLSDSHLPWR
jgi:hypothetical protein